MLCVYQTQRDVIKPYTVDTFISLWWLYPALYGGYIHPYIVDIPAIEGRIYPALYEEDIMTRTHKED
jgi:hypothetical protein